MFLLSCGVGFLLGILYDVFRLVRMAFFSHKAVVFFQDVLYFTLCACLTFLFVLTMNYGEIRGYVILGEALGWIIYYYSVGAMIFRVSGQIVKLCRRVAAFVLLALSAPFRLVFLIFGKIADFIVKITKKMFDFFHINFRINLKRAGYLLYNHNISKKHSGGAEHEDDENEAFFKKKTKRHT